MAPYRADVPPITPETSVVIPARAKRAVDRRIERLVRWLVPTRARPGRGRATPGSSRICAQSSGNLQRAADGVDDGGAGLG